MWKAKEFKRGLKKKRTERVQASWTFGQRFITNRDGERGMLSRRDGLGGKRGVCEKVSDIRFGMGATGKSPEQANIPNDAAPGEIGRYAVLGLPCLTCSFHFPALCDVMG